MALRAELTKATPRLQAAISGLQLPSGMDITSIISGPHAKHSAHFAGRAVDVSLPHTAQAWDFIVNAIRSGQFARIGSTAAVVNDPGMQAWARENGVELFQDEGTGSHAHLEVAP